MMSAAEWGEHMERVTGQIRQASAGARQFEEACREGAEALRRLGAFSPPTLFSRVTGVETAEEQPS